MRRVKPSSNPSAIEQAAQRNWNEAYGFHREQARRWFLFGSAALVVSGISVGAACWMASQNKLVPYVIVQDNHGMSAAVGRLEASIPDVARLKGHMATWVSGFRAVYADATVQQKLARQTYDWVDQSTIAKDQLDEWYIAHRPQDRVKLETVDVDVQSVIPQGSGNVFQVDWQETAWRREPGRPPKVSSWRMIATIKVVQPTTDEEMRRNWDGVFVVSFHVQQLTGDQS